MGARAAISYALLGLLPGKSYSSSRVLISRPYLGRMILQIIGIVFATILLLLSLLLLLWQVLPPPHA